MDEYDEKEIYDKLKISIFSLDEKIKQYFLKAFKPVNVLKSLKESEMGLQIANIIYKKSKRFRLQFFIMSSEQKFKILIPTYMRGSHGIIYFYNINNKIDENRLNLVLRETYAQTPILFAGYDSILPKNPEKIDLNIQIINKYIDESNLIYISTDNQECMFQLLDEIIRLQTIP